MQLAQAGALLGQPHIALEGAQALTRRLGHPYGAARLVAASLSRLPGRTHECTRWYELMLQADPWDCMAAFNCAARYIAARRWDEARELCLRSTAAYSNGQPHNLLARMYALGLLDDAEWTRAQRRCRNSAALDSALAYARMRMQSLEAAADYRPDPAAWIDMHSWTARARYLMRAGRAPEILPHQAALLRTVKRGPSQLSQAWTDLGMANFAAGNFEEAARCFEKAGAAWGGPRNQQACAARAAAVRAWGAKQTRPSKVAEDSLQIAVVLDYIGRYDEAAQLIEQTAIIIGRQPTPAPLSFRRTMLRIRVSALLRGGRAQDALAALSAGLPDVSFGGRFVPLWTRAMAGAGEWERFIGYLAKQAHVRMAPFHAAPPMIEAAMRGGAPHVAALMLETFEVNCLTAPAEEEFTPVGDVRTLRRIVWDAVPEQGGTAADAAARVVKLLMAQRYAEAEDEAKAALAALPEPGTAEPAPARVAASQPGLRATLWWLTARARAGRHEPEANRDAWRVGTKPVRADDTAVRAVAEALQRALDLGWTTDSMYYEAPELRRLRAFDQFDPYAARFKR
jgi:tetratricopeptide (TPR) repeat protein